MNRYRIIILLICFTLLPEVLADYPFEKIFTVKSQRIQLDRQRLQSQTTQLPAEVPKSDAPIEQLSKTKRIRFSGYLKRNDGSEIYWHEGKTELGGLPLDVSVEKADTNGEFIFRTADSQALLKPGQIWLIDKEKVVERYELQGSETQSGGMNRPELKQDSDPEKQAKLDDALKK